MNALHGDIGLIQPADVVLFISYSGATAELLSLLPLARLRCSKTMALTANGSSPLATGSDVWLDASIGTDGREADPDLPAPTSSSVVALALLQCARSLGLGVADSLLAQ
jgi:arabinose-5-phosphate isomerase